MNAYEVWSKWPEEMHTDDYAVKRIKSARSSKLTPVKVDKDDLYGYFQGSSGRYETWLDKCPCGDFHRGQRPCKHMYRLAMELGVFEGSFDADVLRIPTPKKDKITLSESVDVLEGLSKGAQRMILTVAAATKDGEAYWLSDCEEVQEALRSEILKRTDTRDFRWCNYTELKRHLDELGIVFDRKMKVTDLKAYLLEHNSDDLATFLPELIGLYVNPLHSRRNIHYYLHRKWDSEEYYDPNQDDYVRIQVINTDLSDDLVTEELVKRGYYKRK